MRGRDLLVVYRKELRETLRDRRTLFVMILLPLVLYPVVTMLSAQWFLSHEAARRTAAPRVVLVGAPADAPGLVGALRRAEAPLEVVERPGGEVPAHGRALVDADVIVKVPRGFDARIARGDDAPLSLYYDATDARSTLARERIEEAVGALARVELDRRLARHGLPRSFTEPVSIAAVNVASPARQGRAELARILPFVIVLMVLVGSFYPAIDLTAGERERGTLEPLLATPVARRDLVVGKYLAVATIAAGTGLLNVACTAITVLWVARTATRGAGPSVGAVLAAVPWGAAGLGLLALIGTALFFAGVMMAVASLARSFKEAQSFLTPVYLVGALPTMVSLLPGAELGWGAALVPVANVTLLLQGAIAGELPAGPAVLALAATTLYAAGGIGLASQLYRSERLLFGPEGTRPGLGLRGRLRALWSRRGGHVGDGAGASVEQPGPPPPVGAGEALALFGMVTLLFVLFAPELQGRGLGGLAASQWLLIAAPVVLFAVTRPRGAAETLALRRPSARALAGGALIGSTFWILLVLIVFPIQEQLAPAPPELTRSLEELLAARGSLPLRYFAIAITPAIAEELLCRGLLLRALTTHLGRRAAIVAAALLFAMLHMTPYRLVPQFLLGLSLGWVTLASGSVWPAVLIHALHNAALVTVTLPPVAARVQDVATGLVLLVALFVAAAAVVAGHGLVRRAPMSGSPHGGLRDA